jgi:FKBP-type peptidyl-prolyl cis-trans isomerase
MRPLLAAVILYTLLPAAHAADAPAPEAVQAFLATHAHAAGVTVRPSGLQVRIIRNGLGRHVTARDTAQIYFTARLADGRIVDGTSPGLPAPLDPGATLPGLGEGLQQMREGDHWELTLPPKLAFGAKGTANGTVPPNQALVFDVNVVTVAPSAGLAGAGLGNGLSFSSGNGESHAYFTIHP